MREINFVDPKINNIEHQEISIQVGLSGFSFLIRDIEGNCLALKSYRFKNILLIDELIRRISLLISNDPVFNNKFTKSKVFYISQKSTLVPEEFFNPEHLKKYFEFSQNLNELDELHYNYLPKIQAYNVFSISNYLTSIFYSLGLSPAYYHQATNLISYGAHTSGQTRAHAIISLNKTFFDIIVFERGKLMLSNSFEFTNPMDFIYFFLYTFQQLKIDLKNLSVEVLGDISERENLIEEIAKHTAPPLLPSLSVPSLCKNLSQTDSLYFYNLFIHS